MKLVCRLNAVKMEDFIQEYHSPYLKYFLNSENVEKHR
jgi:hypothetical protein